MILAWEQVEVDELHWLMQKLALDGRLRMEPISLVEVVRLASVWI